MTAGLPTCESFRFEGLESFSDPDARLWNHFQRCFPGRGDCKAWCEAVLADVLSAPAGLKATLSVSNVMRAGEEPQRYVLEHEITTIGREQDCDIVLPEQVITKRHARITRQGEQFLLEDLGSSLGTHRRNKKLEPETPVELFERDQFSVFPYNFQFSLEHVWAPETDLEIGGSQAAAISGELFEASQVAGFERFAARVEPAGTPFWIDADRRLLEEILTGLAPSLGRQAPAAGLLETDHGMLEFFLLALWERVNRDLQWDCRIALAGRGALSAKERGLRGVASTINLRLRQQTRTIRLFLPFATIEAMKVPHRDPATGLDRSRLSWRCPVTIGSVELTAAELRSIERLDVLLPDRGPALWLPGAIDGRGERNGRGEAGPSGSGRHSPGSFRAGWTCSPEEGNFSRFRVDNYFDTEQIVAEPESSAEDESPDESPQAGAPTLDAGQLPVQLHVILGEKHMSLAELEQLAPGTVVQLDRGDESRVELAVNGRIVGHGELVRYEGSLGVKVLGWRQE